MEKCSQPATSSPSLRSQSQMPVNTIGPHITEAEILIRKLRLALRKDSNRRLHDAFTALAHGDAAVGMLAFYLWRRRSRRWT